MLNSESLGGTVPIWINESGTGDVLQLTQSVSQRWWVNRIIGRRSHSAGLGSESEIQSEQATNTASQLALSCGFFSQNLRTRQAPYIPFSSRKANASPTEGSFFLAPITLSFLVRTSKASYTCPWARLRLRVEVAITMANSTHGGAGVSSADFFSSLLIMTP